MDQDRDPVVRVRSQSLLFSCVPKDRPKSNWREPRYNLKSAIGTNRRCTLLWRSMRIDERAVKNTCSVMMASPNVTVVAQPGVACTGKKIRRVRKEAKEIAPNTRNTKV